MKQFGAIVAVGVAAFLLGSGSSFLFAAWNNAPSSPPSGNVPAPLNVGDDVNNVRQEKIGGLIIKKDFDVGGKAKIAGTLEVVGDAKLKDAEITGKVKKDLIVEGKAKLGTSLEVGAGGTFGGTLLAPLIVVGPLSPAGALGATVLTVGGQIQIRGGSPAEGRVLTSDGSGVASWQAPAVKEIVKGSDNVTVNSSGGKVTISVAQPYIPSYREVPSPPGGGKILYSNSPGSMSWGDPPRASAPSKSGTECGGYTQTPGSKGGVYYSGVWGCATSAGKCTDGSAPQQKEVVGDNVRFSCVYP
ncbi:MAG: hypothetical protein HYW65_00730 [Candidatus Liptonbacteria bacterium]|nr:hypothetical protein [Candidatus Liptonbacteria bacterium]